MAASTVSYASTPMLTIGGDLALGPMHDLLELSVDEDVNGMTSLEARFVNWGYTGTGQGSLYLDRTTFDFGKDLKVAFGPDTGDVLFTGKISALQADYPDGGAGSMSICAEDAVQSFRLTRRTRTFDDASTKDIATTMASEHGLSPQIDLDGPTRKVVNQLNISDLAFLRSLAYADGGELWLDDKTLHLQGRAKRDGGTATLTYPGSLQSFSVRADLAHQVTDVSICGWSVADKDAIKETGDSSALGAELGSGDTSGSDVLEKAFRERHEMIVVGEPLQSDDATARAKAAYLDRARRFLTGTGTTAGSPSIRVGTRVTLAGLSPLFNGDYRVIRTRHHYDLVKGYTTEFDVERAGIGASQ